MRKRGILLICVIILLLTPICASAAYTNPFYRLLLENEEGVSVCLYDMQALKVPQFDENRTDQLNRLLRHISLLLTRENKLSQISLLVDGSEALHVKENVEGGQDLLMFSFDEGKVYGGGFLMPAEEKGEETAEFAEETVKKSCRLMDEMYSLFERLPDLFPELVRTQGTSLRFREYGIAVKRISISFSAEMIDENPLSRMLKQDESPAAYDEFSEIMMKGSQKVTLLYDQDDCLIRITYDGIAGYSEEDMRRVSLSWKCKRSENETKDSISIKTPAVKGSNRNNMTIERTLVHDETGYDIIQWSIEVDELKNKERRQISCSADLKDENGSITGSALYHEKAADKEIGTEIRAAFRMKNSGEYDGTLEIVNYSGKIEKEKYQVSVLITPGASIEWKPEASGEAVSNDDEETFTHIRARMIRTILKEILQLPEEDLDYIRYGISRKEWNKLIGMISGIGD